MGNLQVVEALFQAWVDRATGWLTCTAQGRETKIPLREGSVVGTSLHAGFGWQGTVPALVQAGRLGLEQLDALWARGEADAGAPDTLEELDVTPAEAASARVLASVREAVRRAESARFEAGEVGGGDLVSGAQVVREAWAVVSDGGAEPAWYRVKALAEASRWDVSEEELRWLAGFEGWTQARGATPRQRALLEVLARSGGLDCLSAEAMRRREEEERQRQEAEAARLAEEAEKSAAAERERQALEAQRRAAEEAAAAEAREREEEEKLLRAAADFRARAEAEARAVRQREEEEAQARLMPPQQGEPSPPFVPPSSPSGLFQALPAPTEADLQLSVQIEARFAQLARKDHFLTLGVSPSATSEEILAAFQHLAPTFHPDQLPPSLAHLTQKMSAVFDGLREASETLADEGKRAAWLASRGEPAPERLANAAPTAPTAPGTDLLKLAEACFKKRDYRQAEQLYARAAALEPSATTLAAQAWAIYMDPSRKAEAPLARELMHQALTIDPHNDRAHYQLGVISRVEGAQEQAEQHFREAVKANPKHLEANQELRLIELRKRKEDPNKGGGGLG